MAEGLAGDVHFPASGVATQSRATRIHPDIDQAVVCGVPDARLGEVGFAFCTAVPGRALTGAEVIEHCRGRIADYKVPRHVEVVAEFPRTSTNKIQRYLLQRDAAGRFEDEAAAAMGGSR